MKKAFKRIGLGVGTIGLVIVGAAAFMAFEAHVVNVTARIENALTVPTTAIDFGTVFPQEHLEQPLLVSLSDSFLAEDRVDDIDYFIRQKPKCAITTDDGQSFDPENTATGHIIVGDATSTPDVVEEFTVDCGEPPRELVDGETWGVLPSLCEYISKEADGTPENDDSLASFHTPWVIENGEIVWTDTRGRLAKSENDTEDNWTIDLAVPCFGGFCAQDWEDFVAGINPEAVAADFVQPIENEHKIFGCDLWIEVAGVSETNGTSTLLTITKTVINDNEGTATTTDFTFMVDGGGAIPFEADGTNVVVVTPGAHTVAEPAVDGYTATFGGDCDATGNVIVPAGENRTCTITNDDIDDGGTIVVTKVVTNDNGGTAAAGDFALNVSGTVVTSGVP
jgi:hypothetical protein